MNLVLVPMWIVSGVFFLVRALSRRGAAVHQGAAAHRARRRAARQHAAGRQLGDVAPALAALGGCLVVCFALAMKMFRWR